MHPRPVHKVFLIRPLVGHLEYWIVKGSTAVEASDLFQVKDAVHRINVAGRTVPGVHMDRHLSAP